MKAITRERMQALDRAAIEEYGILGIVLMENAGIQVTVCILDAYASNIKHEPALIICGTGNNGGDGFVIARHLFNKGYKVQVVIVGDRENIRGDALTNYSILTKIGCPVEFFDTVRSGSFDALLSSSSLIVDALFGTGLDRVIDEPYKSCIEKINNSEKPVVAVDIPSGVHANTGEVLGCAVRAACTVTFGYAKQGIVTEKSKAFVGTLVVADISLPKNLV